MTTDQSSASNASRRVTVTRSVHGWEVKEVRDDKVVRSTVYTDWHRVERAIGLHGPAPARLARHGSSASDVE